MQLDRVAGTLLGLACGDALGAGYEGRPGPIESPDMIGGGFGRGAPGEWTDDTAMAICVAEETATGSLDPHAVGERFLTWYRSGPGDVGIQTRAVLSDASSGADLPTRARDYFATHPGNAAGNGSLMRTAPVALANLGDDRALVSAAMEISAITHADPTAGEACALWCVAIDRAVREGRLDGIRDGLDLLAAASRDAWRERIEEAETRPPSSFRRNGWVVTALQAAHAAVHQTPIPDDVPARHLRDAIEAAVRIGDDTDTVAAIAGSLLGARWGCSAVPLTWRRRIHGWPGYRARDLVRLAILTAKGGAASGWPAVASMRDEYARWSPRGVAEPLERDPDVLVGDFAGLDGPGGTCDVVMSLCRVGTDDVREAGEAHEIWLLDEVPPEDNPNLDFILDDLATEVGRIRDEGKTVFIHCVRAESRTPTVAAAYLIDRFGVPADEAVEEVTRTLGSSASPNRGFREALGRLAATRRS